MRTLINWTAKRAGGRITVYGTEFRKHQEDREIKVVGVDRITMENGEVIATTKDQEKVILSIRR